MALQLSVGTRNAQLDAIETEGGTAPVLKIRTGSPPANCAASDSGTVLASLTLPSDWMAAASSGSKSKSGTWEDLSADGSGVAAHFRLYKSGGSTCFLQGTCGLTSSGEDLELDNTNIQAGQQLTVTSFTINAANS